jgi:hypothetical protein
MRSWSEIENKRADKCHTDGNSNREIKTRLRTFSTISLEDAFRRKFNACKELVSVIWIATHRFLGLSLHFSEFRRRMDALTWFWWREILASLWI